MNPLSDILLQRRDELFADPILPSSSDKTDEAGQSNANAITNNAPPGRVCPEHVEGGRQEGLPAEARAKAGGYNAGMLAASTMGTSDPNHGRILTIITRIKTDLDLLARCLVEMEQYPDVITGEKTITGIFTGEKMKGADGKEYAVPERYVCASQLPVGKKMTLSVTKNGVHIYHTSET